MTRYAVLVSMMLVPLAGCPSPPDDPCDDPDGCTNHDPPPDASMPPPPPPQCNNNHVCDSGETTSSCPGDCPAAPACNNNNVCETTETVTSCPADCASTVKFANYSGVPVWFLYAWRCGTTDMGADLLGNNTLPNGYVYTINDANPGCWNFYAKNQSGAYVDSYYGANVIERQTYTWNIY